MGMLTIRAATVEDVPTLLDFIHALAEEERFADPITATAESLRQALFSPTPAAFARVACLDDTAVGFAIYYFTFSTTLGQRGLHLDDLYVSASARGHGVGRALLAHLARLARHEGCGRFEWWALRWNDKAIAFYKKLGIATRDELVLFRASGEALLALAA
jgi:GNAT superfamily N-acetyltransferase